MTQTSPIGRHATGNKRELTLQATEAAIDKPKRVPASAFLNSIARDAMAAVLRDDSEAIANLPTMVGFRAYAVRSRRRVGCWRLIVIAKAYGAWGHCMSGPLANRETVAALAEMINGPTPVAAYAPAASTPNLTNLAKPSPSPVVSTRLADRLGVLAALFVAMFARRQPVRASQPSAAAGASPNFPVRTSSECTKANTTAGSLNCASLPAAP